MDCVKQEILRRHLEKLKRMGSKSLLEQCRKLAKNGNCWFEDKRQWTKIGSENTKQILRILEREPRGFEALICALLHGSKDSQTIAYDILEDEALSEEDIDGILNDVGGEMSEIQEMKVTLIKERKKNLKTSKELENFRRNSLIFSSGRNSPDETQLLSESGRDLSTSIPDLLEELENERRRREEAEREATVQKERRQRLQDEHVQTKKELDDIKRRSLAFSDLSDYASYSDGDMDFDQEFYPTVSDVGESNSADMYDCDEGIWGKCRYGSTHSPTEQALDFETPSAPPSGHVVGALVSKIYELEDKLETEKAKQHVSSTEIIRLQQENKGLRCSMEDIVSALSIEDEFEVVHNEESESESEGYQFIDECCQALENTAFEDDSHQSTITNSNTLDVCSSMPLQASGTWRSLNRLHYEFDDYDNVIEKPKTSASDLKDALRELRQSTSILRSQVQREGLELKALRNRMKYSWTEHQTMVLQRLDNA